MTITAGALLTRALIGLISSLLVALLATLRFRGGELGASSNDIGMD